MKSTDLICSTVTRVLSVLLVMVPVRNDGTTGAAAHGDAISRSNSQRFTSTATSVSPGR